MAVCEIWGVKNHLKRVIDYVNNPEKTDLSLYDDLHNEINYIINGEKTEKTIFTSGVNCSVENSYEQMMWIKEQYNKKDGIIAFHSYQSFEEKDISPELAHKIGIELANRVWGDRFQVVVATHLNTEHIHNHFVINSVSYVDGKRYYDNRSSYAYLRKMNDEICKEYGLSYMSEKITRKGIDYSKYQNISYDNYYKKTKRDLDVAISKSNSYDEFIELLSSMNYTIATRADKLSVRHNDYRRNIRIERKYGKDYTIENIIKQIKGIYIPEQSEYYKNRFKKDKTLEVLLKTNSKGLAYLYIKYLKLLNNYLKYEKKVSLSYEIKRDIEKMDSISKQTNLLVNNNIENEDDLFSFYLQLKEEKNNYPEMKNEIENEIKLCEEIMKRNSYIEGTIEKIEKEVIIR